MKKTILALLILATLLGLLSGCASEDALYSVTNGDKVAEIEMEKSVAYNAADSELYGEISSETGTVAENRKLIRTVYLHIETEEYDALIRDIEAQISANGGYLESIDANVRYSSSDRYADMTIRIPAENLDAMVTVLSELSNVVRRSEEQKDITLSYVDTQSQRDALKIEQERLMELLEQAQSLSDILEIESRLTDVRYQLESIESQLRLYDNQVDYATITLYVEEVTTLTDTQEKGFWQKIGDGFLNSVRSVWSGAKSLFSFVIIALPYLFVLALFGGMVLLIVWLCTRKQRRARKQNQNES